MTAHLERIDYQNTRWQQEGTNCVEVEAGLDNSKEVSSVLITLFKPINPRPLFEVHFFNISQEIPLLKRQIFLFKKVCCRS